MTAGCSYFTADQLFHTSFFAQIRWNTPPQPRCENGTAVQKVQESVCASCANDIWLLEQNSRKWVCGDWGECWVSGGVELNSRWIEIYSLLLILWWVWNLRHSTRDLLQGSTSAIQVKKSRFHITFRYLLQLRLRGGCRHCRVCDQYSRTSVLQHIYLRHPFNTNLRLQSEVGSDNKIFGLMTISNDTRLTTGLHQFTVD